jgi:hypothetical protein
LDYFQQQHWQNTHNDNDLCRFIRFFFFLPWIVTSTYSTFTFNTRKFSVQITIGWVYRVAIKDIQRTSCHGQIYKVKDNNEHCNQFVPMAAIPGCFATPARHFFHKFYRGHKHKNEQQHARKYQGQQHDDDPFNFVIKFRNDAFRGRNVYVKQVTMIAQK